MKTFVFRTDRKCMSIAIVPEASELCRTNLGPKVTEYHFVGDNGGAYLSVAQMMTLLSTTTIPWQNCQ